jgi:hypothetical protein
MNKSDQFCNNCGTAVKPQDLYKSSDRTTSSYNNRYYIAQGKIMDHNGRNLVNFKRSFSGFGRNTITTNIGSIKTNKEMGPNNLEIENKSKMQIGKIEILDVDLINLTIGEYHFLDVNLVQNPLELRTKHELICSMNFQEGVIDIRSSNVDTINGILIFLYFFHNYWNSYVSVADYQNQYDHGIENLLFTVDGPKGVDSVVTFYDKNREKQASIEDNMVGGIVLIAILAIIALEIVIGFLINFSGYWFTVIPFDIVLFIILGIMGSRVSRSMGKEIKGSHDTILGIVKDDEISSHSMGWEVNVVFDRNVISQLYKIENGNGVVSGSLGAFLLRFGRMVTDIKGNKLFYVSGFNKSYRIFSYKNIDPTFIYGLSFLMINKYLMPKETGGGGG